MNPFSAVLAMSLALFFARSSDPQVFSGEISDTQCAFNVHSRNNSHDDMIKTNTMGRTPQECANTCVKFGGKYVFIDAARKKIYRVDEQSTVSEFAGKRVRIRGYFDKQEDLLKIVEIKPL